MNNDFRKENKLKFIEEFKYLQQPPFVCFCDCEGSQNFSMMVM